MKKIYSIFTFILLCMLVGCGSSRMVAGTGPLTTQQAVHDAMANRNYTILITDAQHAPNVSLSSGFMLSVNGSDIESYLPFFGRSYNIPYAGGEGFNFTGQTLDYRSVVVKGGVYDVRFTVITREDKYEFAMLVYPNGRVYLTVSPFNKESLNFNGIVDISVQ